jgi:hypothetical protein
MLTMNNIILGALLFFICSTGIFGYVSYELSEQKGMAVQALQEAQETVSTLQDSLNLKNKSCKIDDASVVELDAEKKAVQTKTDEVSNKIEKLRYPVAVKQETIKNENLKETSVLPDDGLLSPSLVSLLRENYCSVEPTDDLCRTP